MRLIDADKLKKHYSWWKGQNKQFEHQKAIFDTIIDLQKTVDPVKHAEWKEDGCLYKCSNCGNTEEYYDFSYCPCCGARMDG